MTGSGYSDYMSSYRTELKFHDKSKLVSFGISTFVLFTWTVVYKIFSIRLSLNNCGAFPPHVESAIASNYAERFVCSCFNR